MACATRRAAQRAEALREETRRKKQQAAEGSDASAARAVVSDGADATCEDVALRDAELARVRDARHALGHRDGRLWRAGARRGGGGGGGGSATQSRKN